MSGKVPFTFNEFQTYMNVILESLKKEVNTESLKEIYFYQAETGVCDDVFFIYHNSKIFFVLESDLLILQPKLYCSDDLSYITLLKEYCDYTSFVYFNTDTKDYNYVLNGIRQFSIKSSSTMRIGFHGSKRLQYDADLVATFPNAYSYNINENKIQFLLDRAITLAKLEFNVNLKNKTIRFLMSRLYGEYVMVYKVKGLYGRVKGVIAIETDSLGKQEPIVYSMSKKDYPKEVEFLLKNIQEDSEICLNYNIVKLDHLVKFKNFKQVISL